MPLSPYVYVVLKTICLKLLKTEKEYYMIYRLENHLRVVDFVVNAPWIFFYISKTSKKAFLTIFCLFLNFLMVQKGLSRDVWNNIECTSHSSLHFFLVAIFFCFDIILLSIDNGLYRSAVFDRDKFN